jgi:peptide/nickel transport system permease protein
MNVATHARGWWARTLDSDLALNFLSSPGAMVAAFVTAVLVLAAATAPWISPHHPLDLASLDLLNAELPPAWRPGGNWSFVLGTDNQGRDVLSAILYGLRTSLLVGFASIAFAMLLGVSLGLAAGFLRGWVDSVIMRIADIQLTFPAILIALLISGVARTALPQSRAGGLALAVLILSIGLANWVQYARIIRALTMVESQKDYVLAARTIGQTPVFIAVRHILPNAIGPVTVVATINLALAILTEATLSFLGAGTPPTEPSLGSLVRTGNEFMFSGSWWVVVFPSLTLVILILAVNVLGDWLRDALNPRLR